MSRINLSLYLIPILALFGLMCCETTPKCEKENYGIVTVTNESGKLLMVDCLYSQFPEVSEGEFVLQNRQSVSWNRKPGAQLILTAAVYYETGGTIVGPETMMYYSLSQCETFNLSWILYKDDIIVPKE